MTSHPGQLAGATLLALLSGCAAPEHRPRGAGPPPTSASTTLDGYSLGTASTDLLGAMRGRVRGMQVREGNGDCPFISFRGTRNLYGRDEPVVYVDGVRATDTCILTTLQTSEVDRVEAYSSGVAPRPPYKAHPNGLIIVYMHHGPAD